MRVLYFTAVVSPDEASLNGGVMSSRLLMRRLCEDPHLDVRIIITGAAESQQNTTAYLNALGVPYRFIPLGKSRRPAPFSKRWFKRLWLGHFGFGYESLAAQNHHVPLAIRQAADEWGSEVLIVDYLPSMSFCAGIKIPTVLVTMNREAEYLKLHLDATRPQTPFRNSITVKRAARFERDVYSACSKVVTLGAPDIPTFIDSKRTACIAPYLDEQQTKWQHKSANSVFFVGNINHFPNYRAIEFMARSLVPRVAEIKNDIRFKIVGANECDVPETWRHPSIDYLGESNGLIVQRLFQTASLFICPIDNTFGMKFKIAEAISYGTPLVLTPESAKCVPQLPELPLIELSDPGKAASLICQLVTDPSALQRLSSYIIERQRKFTETQKNIWSHTLLGLKNSDLQSPLREYAKN